LSGCLLRNLFDYCVIVRVSPGNRLALWLHRRHPLRLFRWLSSISRSRRDDLLFLDYCPHHRRLDWNLGLWGDLFLHFILKTVASGWNVLRSRLICLIVEIPLSIWVKRFREVSLTLKLKPYC
jgi:hypothetical protein